MLPGIVQAYIEAPIYARTSGYLKPWYTDIGARVHKGQLLAEIETPEVDRQLAQARADLATAQANLGALAAPPTNAGRTCCQTQSVSQAGRRRESRRCGGQSGDDGIGGAKRRAA